MSRFDLLRCVRLKQLDDLQLFSFQHLQNLLPFVWRLVAVFCKRMDLSIQTTDPIGIWPAYLKIACWPTVKILDVIVCMPEDLHSRLSRSSEADRAKESLQIVKRLTEVYGVQLSHGL